MENLLLSASSINWDNIYGGRLVIWYVTLLLVICLFVWLMATNKRSFGIYFICVIFITGIPMLIMWGFMESTGELKITPKTTGEDIAGYLKQPLVYGIVCSLVFTAVVAFIFLRYRERLDNSYRELNEKMLGVLNNLSIIVALFATLVSMMSIFSSLLSLGGTTKNPNIDKIMNELTKDVLSDTVMLFILLIAVANLTLFGSIVKAKTRNRNVSDSKITL